MMRIAVYHNLHSGGAKRVLCQFTQLISKRHRVDVYDLSCSDRDFCEMGIGMGQRYTYAFTPLPQLSKPFGRLNYAARLLDLFRLEQVERQVAQDIEDRNYDVVLMNPCQFTQGPGVMRYIQQTPTYYLCPEPLRSAYEPEIMRPYAARGGVKRAFDRMDFIAKWYFAKRKAVDRESVKNASMVVVNSRFTSEAIYRIYGVHARTGYAGIDETLFRPLSLPRTREVVSVGALTPNKGFDFVIQSLGLIPERYRPALKIISNYQEANEKAYLTQLARALGVNLHLVEMVSDEVLLDAYNRAAVVAYAPILEPLGLVPLEAMACGTPVVGVAEGGVRETVIHDRTGLLVERDPQRFADAVAKLLSDTTLADAFGKAGRETVLQHWTWDKIAAGLERSLLECAGKLEF
jgi:glycosyltransferase involved in cell wall biosynthesis